VVRLILTVIVAANILPAARLLQDSSTAWTPIHGSALADTAVRHNDRSSVRLEPGKLGQHASAQSAAVHLVIGKTYEISGWVRTQNLAVKELARSPIASGAALTMASMPPDVHSVSVAGDQDWTRLTLRFVATRSEDRILITAGNGGALAGTAWFEGVSIDEASDSSSWPTAEAVRTFGPAYRYPSAGWIYLHIEGNAYERGYQHGYLMAKEIPEYLTRCAIVLAGKADAASWNAYRTEADALFLRGFDHEILEEMRGITDGANAGGAKFLDRKIDLLDVVLANTTVEMGELAEAMQTTPQGLEGIHFDVPPYAGRRDAVTDHCSAFAATGSATKDGKMVIGHVTWWPQTLAEQTNVMLDIKPEKGHRMLIQSYPGGIESGTDWYQNDAGVVLTETTIRQTPFNRDGTPVAFRARLAIQYADNVDDVVRLLGEHNNGLYTNEWIIGDAKNNEIAMYELGTRHTRLWRSSKNEWFGNTPGFYWGNNNAKDLAVNLEYLPDPKGEPEYVPYVPAPRDLAWLDLYKQYNGHIDEQFGFTAYSTTPLVSGGTMDAKIVTSDMANHMMVWAQFGRPNDSITPPRETDYGLFPGGYIVFNANPSSSLAANIAANERARLETKQRKDSPKAVPVSWENRKDPLWAGWLLPASESDTWFVAGSAAYHKILQSPDVERAIDNEKIQYRGLKLAPETPRTKFTLRESEGVLFLDALRRKLGDDAFLSLMKRYYEAHTTQTVTAKSFLEMAGVEYQAPDVGPGPAYLPRDQYRNSPAAIVYGTVREGATNRYTAEQLQSNFRERTGREIPIYKDFEASPAEMAHRDIFFIGRPETNSLLASWSSQLGLEWEDAAFKANGQTYASERNALIYAASNPQDPAHMIVVFAGNSPLETARSIDTNWKDLDQVAVVLEDGRPVTNGPGGRRAE
jgi:hypothetical protein